jgi:hypothetical protein
MGNMVMAQAAAAEQNTAMADARSATSAHAYDPRIDFFRGLALVFIFINHIPGNAMTWLTSRAAGLSDAAEVFMFLGGYSAALAYAKLAPSGLRAMFAKALRRALVLVRTHCWMVAAFMLSAYAFSRGFGLSTGYEIYVDGLIAAPLKTIVATPLLSFQAPLLDILPVYIVVLTAVPLMIWLVARSPIMLLCLSGLLWLFAARFFPLVPTITYDVYWAFNPFCWQFMFAIGLCCGWRGRTGDIGIASSDTRKVLDFVASGCCVFGLMVMISVSTPELEGPLVTAMRDLYFGLNKQCLDIWRIMDFLTSAYLIARIVSVEAPWLDTRPARWLRTMGMFSLPVFAFSTLLSLYGKMVTESLGSTVPIDVLVSVAGIALMVVFAELLARRGGSSGKRRLPARAKQLPA